MKQVGTFLAAVALILASGVLVWSRPRARILTTEHLKPSSVHPVHGNGEAAPPPAVSPSDSAPNPSAAAGGLVRKLESTAYCEVGLMAGGKRTFDGAVAVNGISFGTRFRIRSGPLAQKIVAVEDRIGCCSVFDVWMDSCSKAVQYGRRQILIERLDGLG